MRVALIGAGRMGLQHLKALRAVPGSTVVGVADPRADAAIVRDQAGADVPLYDDVSRMLAEAAPEVVHVVTPPATHVPLAMRALESGCHVYVEKPFAPTLAEARTVLETAARAGRLVCAGHQCLFEPQALQAVARIGEIGEVAQLLSHFAFRQQRRELTPAEQCKDILPHAVYPLLKLLRAGGGGGALRFAGCSADAMGNLHALLRIGAATGIVSVSLSGRPVDQYQEVAGTNGAMRVDYLTGTLQCMPGPGTGPGVLLTPYRRAFRMLGAANRLLFRALAGRAGSYAGLSELLRRFHAAAARGAPSPVTPEDILETVEVCERLGEALDRAVREEEDGAAARLAAEASRLPSPSREGHVLVTGGSGLLGRRVLEELRGRGFALRAVSRRLPPATARVAGVEYGAADLAAGLPDALMRGVATIVHCAAETAGGEKEHERNSIEASRQVMAAALRAGVRRVVHVSSLAVLRPSYRRRRPVDERTPIDADVRSRGPYAWGKAESEREMARLASASGIGLRIVRPGPLVDYGAFQPPGRLGREIGPLFVAIGGRGARLPVCDVRTAARVIRSYLEDFDRAPPLLNLIEGPPPTRRALLARHLARRPDLRVLWFPGWLLRILSGPAKLGQRWILGAEKPVDLYAAFAGGYYRTELAESVIARADGGA